MSTETSKWGQYSAATLAGAQRGLFGMPFEHPFDAIKTNMQVRSSVNTVDTVKHILQTKGWRGFYSGFLPNSLRAASKQAYRFPLRIALDNFYAAALPNQVTTKFASSKDLATALTIANLEVFVINPMEKAKVHVMTDSVVKGALRRFVTNLQHRSVQSRVSMLYQGTKPYLIRQNFSWASFLVTQREFTEAAKSIQNKKKLSPLDNLIIGTLVGIVNTACIMPFDYAKTHFQRIDRDEHQVRVFKLIKDHAKTKGIKVLYAGWQSRMVQYVIHAVLTINVYNNLEERFQKNN